MPRGRHVPAPFFPPSAATPPMLKRLIPLLLGSTCLGVHAAPTVTHNQLQALAAERHWLNLGHYQPGRFSGWRSYVDDDSFFLAADGASNPSSELQATLQALYAPVGDDPNQH